MPKQQKSKRSISVSITGDISGQIVVGNNNEVIKSISHSPSAEDLLYLLSNLKSRIQTEASEDKKENAFEKANELERAILEKKYDLVVIGNVKQWFHRNLPDLVDVIARIEGELKKLAL